MNGEGERRLEIQSIPFGRIKCLTIFRVLLIFFKFRCTLLGWPDLANKDTECPVTFKFQINSKTIFSANMLHTIFGVL